MAKEPKQIQHIPFPPGYAGEMPPPGINPKRPGSRAKYLAQQKKKKQQQEKAAMAAGQAQPVPPEAPKQPGKSADPSYDVWTPALSWIGRQYNALMGEEQKPKKKSKATAGGSVESARRAIERRQKAIAATRRELADEASKGGRGKNYRDLEARLKSEQEDLEKAEQRLASAEREAEKRRAAAEASSDFYGAVFGIVGVSASFGGFYLGKHSAKEGAKFVDGARGVDQKNIVQSGKNAGKIIDKVDATGKMTNAQRSRLKALGQTSLPSSRLRTGLALAGGYAALAGYAKLRTDEAKSDVAKGINMALMGFEVGAAVGAAAHGLSAQGASKAKGVGQLQAAVAELKAAKELAKTQAVHGGRVPHKKKTAAKKASKAKPATPKSRVTNAHLLDAVKQNTSILSRAVSTATQGAAKFILPVAFAGSTAVAYFSGATPGQAAERGANYVSGGAGDRYKELRRRGYNKTVATLGGVDAFVGRPVQGMGRLTEAVANLPGRLEMKRHERPMSDSAANLMVRGAAADIVGRFEARKASKAKPKAKQPAQATSARTKTGQSSAAKKNINKKRGTQNRANLKAILKSRRKTAQKGTRKKPERPRKERRSS